MEKVYSMCDNFCVKTGQSSTYGVCNFTDGYCSYPTVNYPTVNPSQADVGLRNNLTWIYVAICLVVGLVLTGVAISVIICILKKRGTTTRVSVEYVGEMTGPTIKQNYLSTVELEPVFVRTNVQN